MTSDTTDHKHDVGDDGLTAEERDHKKKIEKLHRWMDGMRRRVSP